MKVLTCMLLFVSIATFAGEADYTIARAEMVEELRLYAQLAHDPDEVQFSKVVMASMNTVKRHAMIPLLQRRHSY